MDKKPSYRELETRVHELEKKLQAQNSFEISEYTRFKKNRSTALEDLVDVKSIQSMMDDFYDLTNIGIAILNKQGDILVAKGWQDICTKFHRVHPETAKNCLESDLELSNGVEPGTFKVYHCKNGMLDIATPIVVEGEKLGTLFLGQFLFTDETVDIEAFRLQARRYGFNETEYIEALERVPRWSRETVNTVMRFYTKFAHLISELGYRNLKLDQSIKEKNLLLKMLDESRSKFQDMVENLNDVIYTINPQGIISYISPQIKNILGYLPEELVNENFQNYIHSDDLEKVLNSLKAVFDNKIHPSEYRIMTKDGTWRWVRTSTRPIVKDNTITSLHGVLVDIHQRKKAEENQKALQAKLSSAMEIAGLGHWEYDVINDLFFFNDQFYKIFRTTAEDAGGYTMSSAEYADRFVHPEDSHMVKREIEKALSTGDPGYSSQTEHRIRYADGETGYISVHFFVVKNSQGETIRTYGVNQDITQRRQAQKLEAIGSLAGGIAHDFNNLLFPIIGLSELFMEDFSPDTLEYQNALEIFKAGQRGASLVKQILSFSRQSDHRLMPTRVHTILNEAVKLCRSTIPANIEIVREIKKNSSTVMADPTQLHQIAMNLITNAFHALEATGGTILVELEDVFIEPDHSFGLSLDPGKYSRMTISDNGPGIAPTVIEKIFDPYFTTKEKGKGTGLGLATVYGIVKEHGGDIKVESQPGRGTCFSVYFPLIETAASVEADRETNRVFPGTESILLVDDEKPVVQLEKLILERLGYQVTACIGSVEALEIFCRNKYAYDIVVTDMNMPGMTGDELAKEIFLLRPDIPIIICTGFSERINKQKAESLGIKGILMKPVVKTEMAKMIRTLLDESKGASV